jgi:hypothetical protein
VVGDDEAEDGVAQELLPLVRGGRRVLGAVGPVGDGALERLAVPELPAEARGQGVEGAGALVLDARQGQPSPSFATT